ncbi:helix-turn-helix domain-containing protein [Actinacidiphila acidipaludis]|uniref:XRE family transcriptional regulator n=1 Tax=Actinacidiphila acidipaludis TaxID=2873382 RepID=A0ABS7Q407_9ACTN|nr:XRE family transcriptional regulator [Streptomyces acidipaludis]MBY8877896.1 XRE family transcriptional regulator [Streptomyces acidipaludis]
MAEERGTDTGGGATGGAAGAVRRAAGGQSGGAPLATIAASLQRERRRVGLSLAETARRAGIAKSTLSQLESGTGNPSVETLWALSVTLDVPFAQLVDPPRPRVQVVRAGEGLTFSAERSDYVATLLASCPPHARRDIYVVSAQPGSARESEPHMPGLIEHVILSAGRAEVGLIDDPVELLPGDYVSYPGDMAHVFRALEPDTVAVLLSEHH